MNEIIDSIISWIQEQLPEFTTISKYKLLPRSNQKFEIITTIEAEDQNSRIAANVTVIEFKSKNITLQSTYWPTKTAENYKRSTFVCRYDDPAFQDLIMGRLRAYHINPCQELATN